MKLLLTSFLVAQLCLIHAQQPWTQAQVDSFGIKWSEARTRLSDLQRQLNQNENLVGWSKYYALKTRLSFELQRYDSALYFGNLAIDAFQTSQHQHPEEERPLIMAYYMMGKALRAQGTYNQSTEYLLQALKLTETYPYKWKSFIKATIAGNHLSLGNDSLSCAYYKQIEQDSLYMGIVRERIVVFTRLGVLYMPAYLNKPDSSWYYLRRAKEVSLQHKQYFNLNAIYMNLGDLHRVPRPDSAYYYYGLALDFVAANDLEVSLLEEQYLRYSKAFVYKHEGKISEANQLVSQLRHDLKQSEKSSKDHRDLMVSVLDMLSEINLLQGNYQRAIDLVNEKTNYKDTIFQLEREAQLQRLTLQFESEKKALEIARLEQTDLAKSAVIKQRNTIIIAMVIGVLFGLILLGLAVNRRKLKHQFRTIHLEQKLLLAQMNPHFIFNTLNSVHNLIETDKVQAQKFLGSFSNLLRQILKQSGEEFIQLEEEVNSIKEYLLLQSADHQKFTFQIQQPQVDSNLYIPPMFIQPLVENAVVHAFEDQSIQNRIEVIFHPPNTNGSIKCEIRDNGKGLNVKKSGTLKKSLSLTNIRQRLKIYGKRYKVTTHLSLTESWEQEELSGTLVTLLLPWVSE